MDKFWMIAETPRDGEKLPFMFCKQSFSSFRDACIAAEVAWEDRQRPIIVLESVRIANGSMGEQIPIVTMRPQL